MNDLDKLLRSYRPPEPPAGLAQRAAERAASQPQHPAPERVPTRRRDRRGGWRRNLLAGGLMISLGFTSAVATTVASGGRVEIPVVSSVVASVPVLRQTMERAAPAPAIVVATKKPVKKSEPATTELAAAKVEDQPQPASRRGEMVERYAELKKQVELKRAAGLPTPRADRIEATAKRIVERRVAAGKPVPPIEQVEAMVAMREARQAGRFGPQAITEEQLARFAERLPLERREHFLALRPEQQRLVARAFQRMQMRRAMRAQQAEVATNKL